VLNARLLERSRPFPLPVVDWRSAARAATSERRRAMLCDTLYRAEVPRAARGTRAADAQVFVRSCARA